MINEVILKGRLTANPILKQAGQTYVCNIDIVSNEKYKDKENTIYMPCVFWGKTAEFLCNYFAKGQDIIVKGMFIQNDWVDNNGKNRKDIKLKVLKCEFCGSKKQSTQQVQQPPMQQPIYVDQPQQAPLQPQQIQPQAPLQQPIYTEQPQQDPISIEEIEQFRQNHQQQSYEEQYEELRNKNPQNQNPNAQNNLDNWHEDGEYDDLPNCLQ